MTKTRIPIPKELDPDTRAWLKYLRDLNEEADAAEARLRESCRQSEPVREPIGPYRSRRRPYRHRARDPVISRQWVSLQPRDAKGRWIGMRRWEHGTLMSYAYAKCRCPECCSFWNAYYAATMRRWRRKQRAA